MEVKLSIHNSIISLAGFAEGGEGENEGLREGRTEGERSEIRGQRSEVGGRTRLFVSFQTNLNEKPGQRAAGTVALFEVGRRGG